MISPQPAGPESSPEALTLANLEPALTFYRTTKDLTEVIFTCTEVPARAESDLRRLNRAYPLGEETLALSAIYKACRAGLVGNIPDSPGLQRALKADPYYMGLLSAQLSIQRGQEHLRRKVKSGRAARFLRTAHELSKRAAEQAETAETTETEAIVVPAQRQGSISQEKVLV